MYQYLSSNEAFFILLMRSSQILIKTFILVAVFAGVSFTFLSCRHQAENLYSYPQVCFQTQIMPIFQNSCAMSGCHNGSSETGFDFTSYDGIFASVVPGNPLKSPSYQAITTIWGESAMPPKQPLSEENRTLIRLWIEQGAMNTTCSATSGTGGTVPPAADSTYNARACFQRDIFPIIEANCAMSGCHDGKSGGEARGLTSYSQIMQIVSPSNPASSRLYRVITRTGEDQMPPSPNKPLSIAQVDSIYSWISYGALNENCGSLCDTAAAVTFSGTVWPVIQTYCYGCHSGTNAQKGQHLENYQDVYTAASNGKLMGVLTANGYALMPPAGALSSCEINQIQKWIANGSPNN